MRKTHNISLFTLFALLSALLVSACSSNTPKERREVSEQEYYQAAQQHLENHQYALAITNLQQLETRYPFGPYAEQAQLELIYAYYKNYEHDAAAASADRFIRLHPQHPNVDYAYYMKGLASFTEGRGLFERFMPTDLTKRDPGAARRSFNDFQQLLASFPNSKYAPDAKKRMIYLRNLLARLEVHAANYYFKRGAYLAAANRGRHVVEFYQGCPAVADALAVMSHAYHLLGYDDLAKNATQVLATNFPSHPGLDQQGNFIYKENISGNERSWLNALTLGFVDPPPNPGYDTRPEDDQGN